MKFNIYDTEEGMFKLGNIISVFELDGVDKKIALFSSEGLDGKDEMCSLYVAYLEENQEGESYITDIDDKEIERKAISAISDMLLATKKK